jgi:hypothetical protein
MTRDDIIRMAREAGIDAESDTLCRYEGWVEPLARFAHLVYESVFRDANLAASRTILDAAVLEEREACAKVCEETDAGAERLYKVGRIDCAAAIRARGEKC